MARRAACSSGAEHQHRFVPRNWLEILKAKHTAVLKEEAAESVLKASVADHGNADAEFGAAIEAYEGAEFNAAIEAYNQRDIGNGVDVSAMSQLVEYGSEEAGGDFIGGVCSLYLPR